MHTILKSELILSKATARWVLRFLSVGDCEHNPASYNCKLSDVNNNLNDVRRWVRPTVGKISVQTSLFDIFFLQNLHCNAEIMEELTSEIHLQ